MTFVCPGWEKNDVWIDCEATARLMNSIAFWVHLGFPGSATYMKRSIKELDSTTFWLRELVQYSNSSHPSAVTSASCKNTNYKLVLRPLYLQWCSDRACSLLTSKQRLQGTKHKSLTFHKHKIQGCAQTRAGRDGSIHLSPI